MHMDILSSLINELQAKNLDKYFEIEQNATDPKVLKEFWNYWWLIQKEIVLGQIKNIYNFDFVGGFDT